MSREETLPAVANADPACWGWPPPTEAEFERFKERSKSSLTDLALRFIGDDDATWRGFFMGEWQDGRCALCGRKARLVTDHDHVTGLVRGELCRSCNSLEGRSRARIVEKYRQRNPASICGVVKLYFNEFTGEYAKPRTTQDPEDKWGDNNALRGCGI
jgi:Recombination endonuclease VII